MDTGYINEEGYFVGMTAAEIKEYKEAEEAMRQAHINQYNKDVAVIRKLKKELPNNLFKKIANELHESENWINLHIVDQPTGHFQGHITDICKVWVDQYCHGEDSYSGYCYVELPNGKYLCWEYYC